jgi:hypothetical protein
LAAAIPVSGAMRLGDETLLLVGQKKLKVGDTLRISFEGKPYELSISDIGATTFTVQRGEFLHTRAIRLTSSPRP